MVGLPKYEVLASRHAGVCYPGQADILLGEWGHAMDEYLQSASSLPSGQDFPPVLIVPHIDFRVNLELYVHSYAHLFTASTFPELVIILGVGHRCPEEFSMHPFGLQTPYGDLLPDLQTWEDISRKCDFEISRSPGSFQGEHSLDFAACWLETVRQLAFPERSFTILPVLCGGLFENLYLNTPPDETDEFYLLGGALAATIQKRPAGSALIIASIDGCHVGPRFQHLFGGNSAVRRAVSNWEHNLWSKAQPERFGEFFSHLSALQNMFHFDGVGVLSLLLQHFNYRTRIEKTECWFEGSDQSFVTFSTGTMR